MMLEPRAHGSLHLPCAAVLTVAVCLYLTPVVVAVRYDDHSPKADASAEAAREDSVHALPHSVDAKLRGRAMSNKTVFSDDPSMADLLYSQGRAANGPGMGWKPDDYGLEAAYGSSRAPHMMAMQSGHKMRLSLNEDNSTHTWAQWFEEALMAIGGGTGATIGGTGDPETDEDMVRRMRYQDKAVMVFLLIVYTGSLIFSANIAYRQAANTSPVTYYADPRHHHMVTDATDVDTFLETFNQPPKEVYLQVTGFVPLQDPDEVAAGNIDWYGVLYHVAFSFALDLSPWVVCSGDTHNYTHAYSEDSMQGLGVSTEDVHELREFLSADTNDLAIVELQKEVVWHDWEELAINIKQRIRQSGFGGIISVHRSSSETVKVYKNKTWANFMHSKTTKVLWALSLVGWLFYQPYMYYRCTATVLRSRWRMDISIAQYWPLIADKIGADGFNDRAMTTLYH